MKRILSAAAILAAFSPSGAFAQSAVNISGVIDGGVRYDSGGSGSRISVGSGLSQSSRLTFSGIEDLGAGMKAAFTLEAGLALDTGQGNSNPAGAPSGSLSFGRTSAVALGKDETGYISLGRQYTPLFALSAGGANDPFGANWFGGIGTIYSLTARASNSVVYSYGYTARTMMLAAPRTGLGVAAMWTPAETVAPAASKAGEQFGFSVSYGDGRWWVGYGYHQVRGSNADISATAPVTDQPMLKQQTLAASYEFGFGRLHIGFNTGSNGTNVDRRSWHVGATLPFNDVHSLRLLYGSANDRTAGNADFKTFQLGYQYNVSRRTNLYAGYGQLDNNENSQASLSGSLGAYGKGSQPKSVITGVRHVF